MKNYLEIMFWKFAIYLLRKGYGSCIDLPPEKREEACISCQGAEVKEWIEKHIWLIKK